MNICVVGTGYVGLVTGTCFAEFGVKVVGVDKDAEKIDLLQEGKVPFYEPGLEEMLRKNLKEGRIAFTTDIARAVDKALVVFIAVGTPSRNDGSADLSYVEEVARSIGENMRGYKVIITKSTVPVGTGERIREIVNRHQREPVNFDVASNPEFLREGSAIEDFMRPDRVVIGAESEQAVAILEDLYSPLYLIETSFVITNVASAEMIKYASNAYLATKISYINEIANLCEAVGADVHTVAKGMGLDGRIGSKFLHPGPGYGGSCFPKDTRAITQMAQRYGQRMEIVEAVIRVNAQRHQLMLDKILRCMGGRIQGASIGVLGLSFKPNTDDMRESPALPILQGIQQQGAVVTAYDPAAMGVAARVLKGVSFASDPYEAAEGKDALVIMTEWNVFRNLDLERIRDLMRKPRVIDLRNVYDPRKMQALGFEYTSLGRPVAAQRAVPAGRPGRVG